MPKPNREVKGWAKQIGFVQEACMNFPLGRTLTLGSELGLEGSAQKEPTKGLGATSQKPESAKAACVMEATSHLYGSPSDLGTSTSDVVTF